MILMLGKLALHGPALLIDTLMYLKDFVEVFILIFPLLKPLKLLRTKIPFLSIQTNSNQSLNQKSKKKDTLARVQQRKSSISLVLSNHPPFQSFQSLVDQDVFKSYKTTHSLIHLLLNFLTHPSIHVLTQMTFLVPGEHSIQSRSSSVGYHQVPKWPREMCRKHIAQSHYIIRNGQRLWFVLQMTNSVSTLARVLEFHPQQGHMVASQMPDSIFLDLKASGPRHDGLTTIYFFAYGKNFWRSTMSDGGSGTMTLSKGEAIKMEAAYGLVGTFLMMGQSKNSMKTADFRSLICQEPHHGHQKMKCSLAISMTSIGHPVPHRLLGNFRRMLTLHILIGTLVSHGTLQVIWYIWQKRRSRNIFWRYKSGKVVLRMFLMTCKSCMANFFMFLWSIHEDEHTSHASRPCCGFVITIHSYLIDRLKLWTRILSGGQTFCRALSSDEVFPNQSHYTTQQHSRTPVQESESGLSSESSGEPGDYTQGGQLLMDKKILVGPKQSVLSFSFDTLSPWIDQNSTSASMGTTKASLKAGRTDVVATQPSTKFFDESSNFYPAYQLHTLSTQHMSPAAPTPPILPPEVSMVTRTYSSSPSQFLTHSAASSMIPSFSRQTNHPIPESSMPSARLLSNIPMTSSLASNDDPNRNTGPRQRRQLDHTRFTTPLVTPVSLSKPPPYKAGLTPALSSLRPHCLARDRLKLWRPVESRSFRNAEGNILAITDDDLQRVLTVMNSSWSQSTRESYGAGLLVFHVFCDIRGIPEHERCPADTLTLLTFVASCAGAYAGKTLANYVFGIRAWHILHGQTWRIEQGELKSALDGAANEAPSGSKLSKREPLVITSIIKIRTHLNLESPLDAAVFACLTSSFYSLARLGELTVKSIKAFTPSQHVKRGDVQLDGEDRHGLRVSKIRIPCTKTSITGEDIYWAEQSDASDPKAALINHFAINDPSPDHHIFAWKHPNGIRPLTRGAFLKRIGIIAKQGGCPELKGHSIRIGGTLEYLLRGIPFDVVKSMGRWSSEAFTIYLRDHAMIMAPYLQDTPIIEPFTRYTMPQLR